MRPDQPNQPQPHAPKRHAFTLIELVAAIAVILILVTLVAVVGNRVLSSSRDARLTAQLRAISQGIDTFEADFGYLPPIIPEEDADGIPFTEVLTPAAAAAVTGESADDILRANRYHSPYSITVYLLGIGRITDDAPPDDTGIAPNGYAGHDGAPGPGIKDPGRSRCWKNPAELAAGNIEHTPTATGRTYGPYIDIASLENRLALDEDRQLYTITDDFGTPIRYYKDWPTRDPDEPLNRDRVSLERTPIELWSPELFAEFAANNGSFDNLDATVDSAIVGADYALLAAGDNPDKFLAPDGTPIDPFGDQYISEANGQLETVGFDNDGTINVPTDDNDPDGAVGQIKRFLDTNVRLTR
jgi:prepilin-type N-terminal cleavage/methylation domain-containing protein